MHQIKRLTDELWTSYLIRELDFNDVSVSDFKPVGYNNVVASTEEKVLDIERLINMDEAVGRYYVFGCFDRACLEERALVTLPPAEIQNEYDIEFRLFPDGTTFVEYLNDFELEGFLSRYQNNMTYDSIEVIHDLVCFAKTPGNTRIRDR